MSRNNAIAFSGLALFAVLPLLCSIGYAVAYSVGLTGALNSGFTLAHWTALFSEGDLLVSFGYSTLIAMVTVGLSVAAGLYLSLKHYPAFKKGLLSYLIYVPLSFPALVSAFFFFQALSKGGFLSRIFFATGLIASIDAFPDLINDRYGIGITVAHLFICIPFFTLLFISRIDSERMHQYLTLSQSLGATMGQAVRKVALPILLKKTFPNIILYCIFIFGSYEIPVLLGRSQPEMISVLAVRKLQKFNLMDIPQGYAIAVVYTLAVLTIVTLLLRRGGSRHEL